MRHRERTRRQFLQAGGIGAAALAGAAALRPASAAEPEKKEANKRPLTLGFPTYMFRFYTLDQTLAMTQRLAVQHLCLRSFHLPLELKPEEIAAAIAKVKQAGLIPYAGGTISMGNERAVQQAFDYAKAAGFRLILASAPPNLLALVEKKAQEHDLRVALHNHGPEDKLYPTPLAIYEQIRTLDPRIGICHDTGHTLRAGMDPTEQTLRVADRLMDIHLKDVDAPVATGQWTELGRGVMDVPRFLRALRRIGYSGVVGIEHEKNMQDLLPGLAECVGYVRGVMAGIAGPA
jgi:sugar phosphate isomerase/epimerase